jgi:hypothetical protein
LLGELGVQISASTKLPQGSSSEKAALVATRSRHDKTQGFIPLLIDKMWGSPKVGATQYIEASNASPA